jgi:uncharacterized protein (DUF488 family)
VVSNSQPVENIQELHSTSAPEPVYTIGHSTRAIDDFIALLREHEIVALADVRRFPGSRRHPDYSSDALEQHLLRQQIAYAHVVEVGGRRATFPESPNTFWRNDSFRGYADHMSTAEFRRGIERILSLPAPVAIMCAEAVPWRCHRNLISDELIRRGLSVVHVLGPGSVRMHELNTAARVDGDHLIYPAPEEQRPLF